MGMVKNINFVRTKKKVRVKLVTDKEENVVRCTREEREVRLKACRA